MALTVGLTARVELKVSDADTAQHWGSGDVPVLGTPRLLALCEAATVAATTGALTSGDTSVGIHVSMTHRAPVPVGNQIRVEATLRAIEGRKLIFDVLARDGDTLVADGVITRAVIDRRRFIDGATGQI